MDPHQVEGIHQLPAGGIRRVMGIDKPVVVNHHAGSGIRRDIVPPAAGVRRGIHVRKEGLHRRLNREICPAESADQPVLVQGILLVLRAVFQDFRLPGTGRPLADVPPVLIHAQVLIHRQRAAKGLVKHKLAVGGAGRPVHHPVRLIRAVVEIIHADLLRRHPHEGRILLLRNLPVKQHDQAVPRRLRRMLMGRIQKPVDPREGLPAQRPEVHLRGDIVRVQTADGPEEHMSLFPHAALQPAADKAALVLQGIALLLRQPRILRDRLRGADRNPVPIPDPLPGVFLVLVLPVRPPVADGNLQYGIIHTIQSFL